MLPAHEAPVVELNIAPATQPGTVEVVVDVQGAPVVALNIAPATQPGTVEVAGVQGAPVVALYTAPAAHPGTVLVVVTVLVELVDMLEMYARVIGPK